MKHTIKVSTKVPAKLLAKLYNKDGKFGLDWAGVEWTVESKYTTKGTVFYAVTELDNLVKANCLLKELEAHGCAGYIH